MIAIVSDLLLSRCLVYPHPALRATFPQGKAWRLRRIIPAFEVIL